MIRIVNHLIKKTSFGNNFMNLNRSLAPSSILIKNNLIKLSIAEFAEKKKGGGEIKKNDKKAKIEKEKENINKEYEDVGVEDLTAKYKTKVEVNLF